MRQAIKPDAYIEELQKQFAFLVAAARQVNELDLAACLFQENRGSQDPGWSTTITAHEVFEEMNTYAGLGRQLNRAEFRVLLSLYAQLSEAGGVYESLKNIMNVIKLKPYNMWPFQGLVRVKSAPKRVIGPNANATFKDLAACAEEIGMSRLSSLLEVTFRDDLRNAVAHADYIIWEDGLRLRYRNGGYAEIVPYNAVEDAINIGLAFFELLQIFLDQIAASFSPGRDIVGRFSANPPMKTHVEFDVESGSFSISSSSAGFGTSAEFERQTSINDKLGGKVLSIYSFGSVEPIDSFVEFLSNEGFELQSILMSATEFDTLVDEVDRAELWDDFPERASEGDALLASPWGFRWISSGQEIAHLIEAVIEEK